jgi:hypothetical protein
MYVISGLAFLGWLNGLRKQDPMAQWYSAYKRPVKTQTESEGTGKDIPLKWKSTTSRSSYINVR